MIGPLLALLAVQVGILTWSVGQEREVDTGMYAKLMKVESGWRLWRFEDKNGVSCQAVKPARGRPHPQPLGVSAAMWRGTPYLTISNDGDRESIWLSGQHRGKKRQYRLSGARFWTKWDTGAELVHHDGKKIYVHVLSSSALVGRAAEIGVIDLTGLNKMRTAAADCAR